MFIRDMVPGDKSIYLEMAQDFYSGDATLFPITTSQLEQTFNKAVEGSPLMRGLMIEEEGQLAGYALLAFYWSCEAAGLVVQLEELYFYENFRGKGLGKKYFQWVFDQYPDAMRFRLEVCHKNPRAKALYSRLGFKELDYIQMVKQM